MRRLLLIPAILLVLIGLIFTLQGVGILPGSAMSGHQQWALIGIVMMVVGVALGWLAMGRRRTRSAA